HDARAIGFVNFRDYKPKAKSAEIGIGIGEPGLWGKRLGREALDLEVRYLREHLRLHRIGLSVVSHNDRAIWMYKAAGFVVEGIERDGIGRDEGFVDDVKMGFVEGRPRPDFDPRPITLNGEHVRLVALRMEHAQALLEANRVWLPPDKRNEPSQAAIARLGATKEGELRNERVLSDGHLRTSVVFGITKEDWPRVRERLLGYLAR